MKAGRLDRRVTLQTCTISQEADGGVLRTYQDLATVWASVAPEKGQETFSDDQPLARQSVVFTIRYRAGVLPKGRVQYQGRFYNIRDVSEIGRREGLKITADADEVGT
jgi:SPP1 family predicted phage head-tail adaptor